MLTSAASLSGLLAQASTLSDQQAEISRELGTGTRLTSLSNDPLAAAATVRLSSAVSATSATLSAIQTTQARMQAADSALGSAVTQLTSAVSLAVGAANGTGQAGVAAQQLSSLRDSLLGLANTSYNGSYLFGGTALSAAPFSLDTTTGEATYSGTSGTLHLNVDGMSLQTSADGSALFGSGTNSVFTQLQNVITTLQNGGTPTVDQISGIRNSLQTVIDRRGLLDSSASRLQDATTYTTTQQTDLQTQQSTIAADDPVALATQLSSNETQRSALLSTIAALGKNSLFDYLQS